MVDLFQQTQLTLITLLNTMADIEIVKMKVRRGTDAQRQQVVLDQGEPGFTTDYKRLFIGDGSTTGGIVVGSKNFTPVSNKTTLNAQTGDIVYENNLVYQLTGTNSSQLSAWKQISAEVDDSTLEYAASTNILKIKDGGVGVNQLGSIVYSQGGLALNETSGLSANVDRTTIVINGANQLAVSAVYASSILGRIDKDNFSSTSIASAGLSGSADGQLHVNVDNTSIVINNSNKLTVGVIDASAVTSGRFTAGRLDSSAFGSGLQGGNGVQVSVKSHSESLELTDGGKLTLKSLYNATKIPLSSNDATFTGFVNYQAATGAEAILDVGLSGISLIDGPDFVGAGYVEAPVVTIDGPTGGGTTATAVASVIDGEVISIIVTFSGDGYTVAPSVSIAPPPHYETTYQVITATATGGISSDSQVFTLSSGGFLMVDFGSPIGKKAIPVFNVPAEIQELTFDTLTV